MQYSIYKWIFFSIKLYLNFMVRIGINTSVLRSPSNPFSLSVFDFSYFFISISTSLIILKNEETICSFKFNRQLCNVLYINGFFSQLNSI